MLTFKGAQVIKYYVIFAFLFVQTVYWTIKFLLHFMQGLSLDVTRKTDLSFKTVVPLWFSMLLVIGICLGSVFAVCADNGYFWCGRLSSTMTVVK